MARRKLARRAQRRIRGGQAEVGFLYGGEPIGEPGGINITTPDGMTIEIVPREGRKFVDVPTGP